MVDSNTMAEFHRFTDLEKRTLGESLVILVDAALGNVGKQIPTTAELQDHENGILGLHDSVEGDDIGMVAGGEMQFNLPSLELMLPRILGFGQGFDGQRRVGPEIKRAVYTPICSQTLDGRELEPVAQDPSYPILCPMDLGI